MIFYQKHGKQKFNLSLYKFCEDFNFKLYASTHQVLMPKPTLDRIYIGDSMGHG